MIINNNNVLGIKRVKENLVGHFKYMVQNSKLFIAMASYSFMLPYEVMNELAKNASAKIIIIPYRYYARNQYRIINTEKTIRYLITKNVAVIIDSNNHSKFLVNEDHAYFGSVNLTENAMVYNIESIASYDDLLNTSPSKRDIIKFVLEKINEYIHLSNQQYVYLHEQMCLEINGILSNLYKITTDGSKGIERVESNINEMEYILSTIKKILDKYQALLSLDEFYNLARRSKKLLSEIDTFIEMLKSELWKANKYETIYFNKGTKEKFDKIKIAFKNFKIYYEGLIDNIVILREVDEFSIQNTILIQKVQAVLQKYVDDNNIHF